MVRAVSQLLWPDKDREVWSSLTENTYKVGVSKNEWTVTVDSGVEPDLRNALVGPKRAREKLGFTVCGKSLVVKGTAFRPYV